MTSNIPKNEVNILIVDDDPICVTLLDKLLSVNGYNTCIAEDGHIALEMIEQESPDLVLLDIMMPNLDGFETCHKIKSNKATCHIPVIFVTTCTDEKSIKRGFEVGAEDYIRKPILITEVLVRVDHQLQYLERNRLHNLLQLKTKKISNLGNMVTTIAHEVASPFGTLKMALGHLQASIIKTQNALEDDNLSSNRIETFLDDAFEVINISQLNITQVNDVISSFKLIAVDQCNNPIANINLKEYLDSIILSLKPKLKRQKHSVDVHIPHLTHITTKPGALSQVIINLISNSYMHAFDNIESGKIVISYDKTIDAHQLTYEDNGCGINEKHMGKIFEKFFTTKERTGGSGLGMSIIKELIEDELEGSIAVSSKENDGISVIISLPLEIQ